MHVVEEQNERPEPTHLAEERVQLPLQPLLRRRLPLGRLLIRNLVLEGWRDLRIPIRRELPHQVRHCAAGIDARQALECVEQRHVRAAPGQAF